MADSVHRFRYAPGAAIQSHQKLKALADDIKGFKVLAPEGKVPKNAEFLISVMVPAYKALNLVPLTPNKKVEATLLTVVTVIELTEGQVKAGDFKRGVKAVHGAPIRPPQRKKKFKEQFLHQTYRCPAPAGGFTGTKVTVAVRTVHHFFEEDTAADPSKVVPFAHRRSVVKLFEVGTL